MRPFPAAPLQIPAAPHPTRPITSVPRLPFLAVTNRISPSLSLTAKDRLSVPYLYPLLPTPSVRCTLPALPNHTKPDQFIPLQASCPTGPYPTSKHLCSPNLYCRAQPIRTYPITTTPNLDCQTTTYRSASHLNKPERTVPDPTFPIRDCLTRPHLSLPQHTATHRTSTNRSLTASSHRTFSQQTRPRLDCRKRGGCNVTTPPKSLWKSSQKHKESCKLLLNHYFFKTVK